VTKVTGLEHYIHPELFADAKSSSASTYYYDHIEGEWSNGPNLMQRRHGHAAGIVTDKVTNEHFVAVTGGYDKNHNSSHGYLDSTEILQDGKWVQGKINVITLMLCYYINGHCFKFAKSYKKCCHAYLIANIQLCAKKYRKLVFMV
jgi:hypothetical protein